MGGELEDFTFELDGKVDNFLDPHFLLDEEVWGRKQIVTIIYLVRNVRVRAQISEIYLGGEGQIGQGTPKILKGPSHSIDGSRSHIRCQSRESGERDSSATPRGL